MQLIQYHKKYISAISPNKFHDGSTTSKAKLSNKNKIKDKVDSFYDFFNDDGNENMMPLIGRKMPEMMAMPSSSLTSKKSKQRHDPIGTIKVVLISKPARRHDFKVLRLPLINRIHLDFLAQSSEIFGNTNQEKPNYYQGIVDDFFRAIYNSVYSKSSILDILCTLFRNKRFMLDEMTS